VVLAGSAIYDRVDWFDPHWEGWEGLELCWISVTERSNDPPLSQSESGIQKFFTGASQRAADPTVIVAGQAAIVPIFKTSFANGATSQPGPAILWVDANTGVESTEFDVISADGATPLPALSGSFGWSLERTSYVEREAEWNGPIPVGDASLTAVQAYLKGRAYSCPREECGRSHTGSLHCTSGDNWGLSTPRCSLPEVETLTGPTRHRCIVLVTRWSSPANEFSSAELWIAETTAYFTHSDRLYWSSLGEGPMKYWQFEEPSGWKQVLGKQFSEDSEIVALEVEGSEPWALSERTIQGKTDAYLLLT